MRETPIAAGASSYDVVDVDKLWQILNIPSGICVLDLACGWGHYSFDLSARVGDEGTVYAVDLWQEGIQFIETQVRDRGVKNIRPLRADVSKHIPLDDQTVDLCLMATVLHDLVQDQTAEGTLREVQRVVRKGGRLAVVEFKVINGPPGPPKRVRMGPTRTADLLRPFRFSLGATSEVGPFTYCAVYRAGGT